MDVEEELVRAFRVAGVEFPPYAAVGRTDIVGYHVAEDEVDVEHFAQFGGGEIVQQHGALADRFGERTGVADVAGVVEGAVVEPEAVESAAEIVAFRGGEEAAGGKVGFPFFEGVDFFEFLRGAACGDDLVDEGVGDGDVAVDVGGLGGVVG